MHFTTLASVSALAATAFAQLPPASILTVLETALPSSLIAEALTNPGAVSSEVAAEISAGSTPAWFASLPTAIQTYLHPASASASASASSASSASSSAGVTAPSVGLPSPSLNGSAIAPTGFPNATGILNNLTSSASSSQASLTTITGSSGTTTSTLSNGGSNTGSASSTSNSQGAAALPTAAYGMGLAGAVGLVGLLAL